MADEFLTKFYLGLADLLSASVLTPREKKLIEIINKQNAALEAIAIGTMTKSPQEVANLAKGATVVIAERGEEPVSVERYAAKIAEASPQPEDPPPEEERIKAFSAGSAAGKPKLVAPEVPTTVGGGLRLDAGVPNQAHPWRAHPDALPALILVVATLCSVAVAAA